MARNLICWTAVFFLFAVGVAFAQDHRGHHPSPGEVDPYAKTHSMAGTNCCHGKDCTPWHGDPPAPETQNSVKGWRMGKWFFREDQRIDPATLPREQRGTPHICIGEGSDGEAGSWDIPRCFYYPYSG